MAVTHVVARVCRTCRAFSAAEQQEGQGECRKKAPAVFVVPGKMGGPMPISAFPPVLASSWCLEWNDARSMSYGSEQEQENKVHA